MVDGNFDLSWQPLAKELGIKVVPTFKILKQGKILKEVIGAKFDDLFTAMEDVRSSWTTIMLRIHMFQIDYPKTVRILPFVCLHIVLKVSLKLITISSNQTNPVYPTFGGV